VGLSAFLSPLLPPLLAPLLGHLVPHSSKKESHPSLDLVEAWFTKLPQSPNPKNESLGTTALEQG